MLNNSELTHLFALPQNGSHWQNFIFLSIKGAKQHILKVGSQYYTLIEFIAISVNIYSKNFVNESFI